ncbi:DNA-3-methyladenine glycosylase [Corynebacterium sp. 3HC-13]|uniref:DNA-3-methyladenine glycosylase n=1 Tax=Corynebacterium poyangense TaxID=2684405 RepID=UPI001CCB6FFC|nr:DNA-3-methyladenine glycosylase [Corynebacterium poyangense]MBZ8177408.1 DNA-3-methyladenine glycosylase [Corynebacterium poyangense]
MVAIDFFLPADQVAPLLLGSILHHNGVSLRLTEIEAYLGADDPAAHSFRGLTQRNAAMFGPGGHMYVYLSYGIHRAGNITCGPEGVGHGCLLRAGEVMSGHAEALRRRQLPDTPSHYHRLAQGPGNLGSALGLTLSDNHALVSQLPHDDPQSFWISAPTSQPEWACGPRIGISRNTEAPLRFWIPGEPSVSRSRRRPTLS